MSPASTLLLACGLTTSFDGYDVTATRTYKVGGSVAGLSPGDTVTLRLNGTPDTPFGNGGFVFSTPIPDGATYFVDVGTAPLHGTCTIQQAAFGTIAGGDVTDVQVVCASNESELTSLALAAPPGWVSAVDPAFDPGQASYGAQAKLAVLPRVVPSPVLTVSTGTADPNAKVRVADGGPIVLTRGPTQFPITVTAPDTRTTSAYQVTVTAGWSHYLKASNNRPVQTLSGIGFGSAVALDAYTLVVGAPQDPSCSPLDPQASGCGGSGTAYVFQDAGGLWTQQAFLKASTVVSTGLSASPGPLFGSSVGISGDTAVVGAPQEASCATGVNGDQTNQLCPGAGAAYVFTRVNTSWSQQAYLKASNTHYTPQGTQLSFGFSVAIAGDTIVVGAPFEPSCATGVNGNQNDTNCSAAGATYVFTRSNGTWSQQAYLKASNAAASNDFGSAVGVAGDTAIVGARNEGGASNTINGDQTQPAGFAGAGAAYAFGRSGAVWTQEAYIKPSDNGPSFNFGASVAISSAPTGGSYVVVGAPAARGNGEAYQFNGAGTTWEQDGQPTQYTGNAVPPGGELLGTSVAVYSSDAGPAAVFGASGDATCSVDVSSSDAVTTLDASFNAACPAQGTAFVTGPASLFLKPPIYGTGFLFGQSVAVSGNTIAIGASSDPSCSAGIDGDPTSNTICGGSGAVYVF